MHRKIKKIKWLLLIVAACMGCFLFVGTLQEQDNNSDMPVSSIEQFDGQVYDEDRLTPQDMATLLENWDGKTKKDVSEKKIIFNHQEGWKHVAIHGKSGFRYYTGADTFLIGWQYVERHGQMDWYYFNEVTGFMIKDTVLDGVLLSKQGYAIAATANTEETFLLVNNTAHCRELLLEEIVYIQNEVKFSKDMTLVAKYGEQASIKKSPSHVTIGMITADSSDTSATDEEWNLDVTSVVEVSNHSKLTLAENVEVSTNGNYENAILVTEGSTLDCYGTVGDIEQKNAYIGICVNDVDAKVVLQETALVSGATIGVYSQGETVLEKGSNIPKKINIRDGMDVEKEAEHYEDNRNHEADEVQHDRCITKSGFLEGKLKEKTASLFSGFRVQAATIDSGQYITGNSGSGIVQNGGTLYMYNGSIYDNGTLGGINVVGSNGGGVHLKNGATMYMYYGVIAANRAANGGGIYVSSGCTLHAYGGRVGGYAVYDTAGSNTYDNGNMARENSLSENSYKYAKGSGGGIYSEGTIYINGDGDAFDVIYNACQGGTGGGGIMLASGKAYVTGNVNLFNNQTYSSAATADSYLLDGGDVDGEGAGIRVGTDDSDTYAQLLLNCTDASGYPQTTGEVVFYENQSSGDGAGIYLSQNASNRLVSKGTTKVYNGISNAEGGGGIKSAGGPIYLYDIIVSGNEALNSIGGGILSSAYTYVENSSIDRNNADYQGGGICIYKDENEKVGTAMISGGEIYYNTATTGGSGVEVQDGATATIDDNTKIYYNFADGHGIHCGEASTINLETCYVYDNRYYGILNEGTLNINDTVMVGYSAFESEDSYTGLQNKNGGVKNSGTMIVKKGAVFRSYGGSAYAFRNEGIVAFQDGSYNCLTTKSGAQTVSNLGTMYATGQNPEGGPLVLVAGKSTYGIQNNSGTIYWSGEISGGWNVTDTAMVEDRNVKNYTYGLNNSNGGSIFADEMSCISSCNTGVFNRKESVANLAGKIYANKSYGINNAGTLHFGQSDGDSYLGTDQFASLEDYSVSSNARGNLYNTGTCIIGTESKVYFVSNGKQNIVNTGTFTAIEAGDQTCIITGAGTGIDNSGVCSLGPSVAITSNAMEERTNIQNKSGGSLYLTGGEYSNASLYGVYCAMGSQMYMAGDARIDTSNQVFLEDGCYIDINGVLSGTGILASLNTTEGADRNPGRVMATVSYDGGKGSDELYHSDGSKKFALMFEQLDTGESAFLVDGSVLNTTENTTITESDIYLGNTTREAKLDVWLYNRSAWLRNQMSGNKQDGQYKQFLAGDTGVITFTSKNLTEVRVVWPATGAPDELKTYDATGTQVVDVDYNILELVEDISKPYENSSYQFVVPLGTPEGSYQVKIIGIDESGNQYICTVSVTVGNKGISSAFRTRIR